MLEANAELVVGEVGNHDQTVSPEPISQDWGNDRSADKQQAPCHRAVIEVGVDAARKQRGGQVA
jgi:hypothetical protein